MPTRRAGLLVGTALALLLFATGCSRLSPLGPDSADSGRQATVKTGAVTWTPVGLTNGTLNIASTSKADALTGRYTGQAFVSSIGETSIFTVTITGGTGEFNAATGTFRGAGSGAFAGRGRFVVTFHGTVTTAKGARDVRVALRGDALTACSPSNRMQVTQSGQGNATVSGQVTGTLRHETTTAGCS